MTLKQMRQEKGLTQVKCAEFLQIPLRTYKRYEADEAKIDRIKYQYILQRLHEYGLVDETHGLLSLEQIIHTRQHTSVNELAQFPHN